LGGAVFQYPRGKLVMTAPVELPIIGKVQFRNTSKEELLKFWTEASSRHSLNIRYGTSRGHRRPGRCFSRDRRRPPLRRRDRAARHRPARHPAKARRSGGGVAEGGLSAHRSGAIPRPQVIVVGGGDSALEAAASIAELGDTAVILTYRGEAFSAPSNATVSASTRRSRRAPSRCCSIPKSGKSRRPAWYCSTLAKMPKSVTMP